jgi:hypothetical protein
MGKVVNVEPNRPKYPQVKIELAGPVQRRGEIDFGFIAMVTAVQDAMREANVPQQDLSNFYGEAAEDADLLQTCLRWVEVDLR